MYDLSGRRCLITGASRGFGATLAGLFWSCGASLVLASRSADGLERVRQGLAERPGQTVCEVVVDLTRPGAAHDLLEQATRQAGGLEVLVNNAAVQGPVGTLWQTDPADWDATFRLDFLAVVDLCRHAVVSMGEVGGGKIINISGGGATGPRPRFSAYASSKAALVRFSETLAEETRDCRIDVNCVAPGAMATAMTEAVIAAGPGRAGEREYRDALRTKEKGDTATERAASLCAFLASSESDGITGKLLSAVWDPWESLAEHSEDLRQTDIYTLRRIVPADRGRTWGGQ